MNNPQKDTGSAKARKSSARLMAVQAVYQMHKNDQSAKEVVREYFDHRIGMEVDGQRMVSADREHFSNTVQGVAENFDQLQEMVVKNRSRDTLTNEPLLNALFLCGAYELMLRSDIDYPIIISDYVHVAQAFFDESESGLVNAVLDSIRKTTR
ncbi:MAG: transcription antitermination factor NusB [Pseudomonadota bacterium]